MSLVATLMQEFRTDYTEQLDKHENRASRYRVYDLFRQQTNAANSIISEQTRTAIKDSFGKTIKIPVFLNQDVSIGNVRTCAIRAGESTNAFVTLTFATLAFGFSMFPAEYGNNDTSYAQDWNNRLRGYINKMNAHLDTLGISFLNINRNQYWTPEITAVYPVVNNALQVSKAGTEDFYNQASAIFEQMDFYDRIDVAANTLHKPVVKRLTNQGQGNDVNDAFQFNEYDFGYSNHILNGPGIASTAYLVQKGSVAMENRNDRDAIMGHSAAGGGKQWGQEYVPGIGLTMGTYYTDDCTDASARVGADGLTRTKVESFEWSTDICLIGAYNSNPAGRFQPILKAEFAAA